MKRRSSILGINRRNLEFVFDDATPGRFRDLDDKLRGKERLEAANVRVPKTLGVIRRPDDLDVLHEVLDTVDELDLDVPERTVRNTLRVMVDLGHLDRDDDVNPLQGEHATYQLNAGVSER